MPTEQNTASTHASRSLDPLAGLRVLELADEKGEYCGKLLADMGADVIKVEPPGGESTRRLLPKWTNAAGETWSLDFLYMNANKRGVVLDLEAPRDRERFAELAAVAELIVETGAPGRMDSLGVGFETLRMRNPGLVFTSITDFGQSGPARDFCGSDLVVGALSGALHVTGDIEDPPVTLAGNPAYISASATAAAASLIALRHGARSGRGQRIDISALEAMAATSSICGIGRFEEDGVIATRYGTGLFAAVPSGAYRCSDGLAYLIVNRPAHWAALAKWIHETTGNEEVLDSMFEGPSSSRLPYRELLDIFIAELASRFTVDGFHREAQKRHIAITPVNTARDLYADAHLAKRAFFVDAEAPGGGKLRVPGAPFRFAEAPPRPRRPAPRLDEHRGETFVARSTSKTAREEPEIAQARTDTRAGALSDVRVIEFTAGMAGPWIGRFMAACDADVIRVESIHHPDVTRLFVSPRDPAAGIQPQLSPWFTDWNAGKRFVSLDLRKAEGLALAKTLIGRADVLIDNYSTGTMKKLGLGADELRAANPGLITLSSTGYGQTGPAAGYVTWGPNIEALSGLATLSGFPERECTITQFAYPDPLSALHGLFAVLCALRLRADHGRGRKLELSQLETTAATLGPRLMEYAALGTEPLRRGNRSPDDAPHNVFRCRGEDRWCAIAVRGTEAWQALCRTIGRGDWTGDPRFQRAADRVRNCEMLEAGVGAWTSERDAYEVMAAMQAAGVAAGVVQNVEDQARRDAQMAARGFFESIPHPIRGRVVATGIPLGLCDTPAVTRSTGAAIGADNEDVFCTLCGLADAEFDRLRSDGAITDQADFLASLGSAGTSS